MTTTKTTKTDAAKSIAKFVIGSSVAFTTSQLIRQNTTVTKRHHKVERYVAGVTIGVMSAEAAEAWTDRKIDSIVAGWYKFKEDVKSAAQ